MRRFAQILAITAGLLIILEVLARAWYWTQDPSVNPRAKADAYPEQVEWVTPYFESLDESAAMRWAPYVYWRRQAYESPYINIDDQGIRRTWQSGDETIPKQRIFVFGGSAVWGSGARDDFTIPSALAKRLSERKVAAEVTNYGESGYVSTQELLTLLLELRAGNVPDVAIFYNGPNDVFAAHQQGVAGLPQNEFNRRAEFNLTHPSRFAGILKFSVRSFLLELDLVRATREIGRSLAGEAPVQTGLSEADVTDLAALYVENLTIAKRLADAYGFQAHFFWQPTVFDKASLTEYESQQAENDKHLGPLLTQTRKMALARGADANLEIHDLSVLFREHESPIFVDWVHTAEQGNTKIADCMAALILGTRSCKQIDDASDRPVGIEPTPMPGPPVPRS